HSGHSAKPGTRMAHFNVKGNAMFPALCRELDIRFEQRGSLNVAFSEGDLPGLQKLLADGKANGVPGLRILEHDELHKLEPNLGPEALAAVWAPTAGIVCPFELVAALAESAAINGVAFHRAEGIASLHKDGETWIAVTTRGIEVRTRAVVNAAGLYADQLNNQVSAHKLEIIPRKGEYWMIDRTYANAFQHTIFMIPGPMGKGILVSPTVDGTVIVGPTALDVAEKEDTATTAAGLAKVLEVASHTWPSMPRNAFITTFAGMRAHLTSHDFVVGEAQDAPLFFNAAGIESPGLTSAPAIGQELAEQIAARLKAEKREFRAGRPPVVRFRNLDTPARAALAAKDPAFGRIVCRCETVTEGEVRDAIRRPVGARTIDGVQRRVRAGMGRCQGGFCMPRVMAILAEELGISPLEITKSGGGSKVLTGALHEEGGER
ncbi:MAG: NAD(P)/FAD-dependent oxidoreductase, partial [Victivallales bacterium]|nr:NAD(P)/FAD-dependent oxidoreductase [Victivallales bacterium]